MTRASVVLGIAVIVAVLSGCAPAPSLPASPSPSEVERLLARQQTRWWESMFPDEPQPVVEPVSYAVTRHEVTDCLVAAHLDGVTVGSDGIVSASGDLAARQLFICSEQYPPDPATVQLLSDEQSEWIYRYNKTRLVPCLRLLGYRVDEVSDGVSSDDRGYWSPYFDMTPIPSKAEWAIIDARCPPSPVGPTHSEDRPWRD